VFWLVCFYWRRLCWLGGGVGNQTKYDSASAPVIIMGFLRLYLRNETSITKSPFKKLLGRFKTTCYVEVKS
jgi:hypothetical protein